MNYKDIINFAVLYLLFKIYALVGVSIDNSRANFLKELATKTLQPQGQEKIEICKNEKS